MKNILRFCLLAFVLTGCATNPVRKNVDNADISPLAKERVAVSYHVIYPRINYTEVLYRVLWLENKASTQDFAGIWSPDHDLSGYATERLRAQGFHADNIYDLISGPEIADANRDVSNAAVQNATMSHPQLPQTKLLPAEIFFSEPPTQTDFKPLSDALSRKGYRYLMQFTAMDLTANAVGYGMVTVVGVPNLRLIDLQTNKVVWVSHVAHAEAYQLGGNLARLEENGMAKTKEAMKLGIGKLDFIKLFEVQPQ